MFDSGKSYCLRNVWGPGVFHKAHDESEGIGRICADWRGIIPVQVAWEVVMPMSLFLPSAFGEQKKEKFERIVF